MYDVHMYVLTHVYVYEHTHIFLYKERHTNIHMHIYLYLSTGSESYRLAKPQGKEKLQAGRVTQEKNLE